MLNARYKVRIVIKNGVVSCVMTMYVHELCVSSWFVYPASGSLVRGNADKDGDEKSAEQNENKLSLCGTV
jgi:hypothetical protein